MAVTLPGWVQVRDGRPGAGTPLQTHVPVALYEPREDCGEWEPIAAALDAKWQETGSPAVVRQSVGRGEMTFFFYDLAKGNRLPAAQDHRLGQVGGRTRKQPATLPYTYYQYCLHYTYYQHF